MTALQEKAVTLGSFVCRFLTSNHFLGMVLNMSDIRPRVSPPPPRPLRPPRSPSGQRPIAAPKSQLSAIIITVLVTSIIVVAIGAVVLSYYGTERVATEVSPFVDGARERITENIVPPSTTSEQTEADRIMAAVARSQGSSVLIYRAGASTSTEPVLVARGLIFSTAGLVVTDSSVFQASNEYVVQVPGVRDRLPVIRTATTSNPSLIVLTIAHNTTLIPLFTQNLPVPNDLVVSITGEATERIATGIVTESSSNRLSTNLVGTFIPGSILVNTESQVIGIATVDAQTGTNPAFTPLTRSLINELKETGDSLLQ